MTNLIKKRHSEETVLYALSRILERAAYYSIRSVIVIYLISKLKINSAEAIQIITWFVTAFLFSKVLGAILGDLVLGNKKALIIGGILQALGTFVLAFPSLTGFYIGLFLIVLGGGLYTPNIIANYGKLFLDKTKLLAAGFSIFYLAANLGGFFGPLLANYFRLSFGWSMSFVASGILMLLSTLLIAATNEKAMNKSIEKTEGSNQRMLYVVMTVVLVSLYWIFYAFGNSKVHDLQSKLTDMLPAYTLDNSLDMLYLMLVLFISIIATLVWSYFYSSPFVKLILGFTFATLSFGILFYIPVIEDEMHLLFYLLSLLLLSISEVYITPVVHSILTQYTNPKYLAIAISLAGIPLGLNTVIFNIYKNKFSHSMGLLQWGFIGMIVLSIGIAFFMIWKKKNQHNNQISDDFIARF